MPPSEIKFQTERTRRFRATALSDEDERTVSHIEGFGCSVVNVVKTPYAMGWSYTVGVFDTCGRPEVITVGLLPDTAQFALNRAVKLLRSGVDLTTGRHRDLIGKVDCEFRTVDPKWIKPFMGSAVWYYGSIEFPVIQAVYPDLKNRFPGEEGFDTSFEQPLMQLGGPMTRTENDFWASTDPKSSLFDWKFSVSPHSQAFLSEKVDSGTEPITFVSHDASDGAWQFLGNSMFEGRGVLVCLHHPIDRDPTLRELADLPIGWYAERDTVGEPWCRKKLPTDDTSE